MISIFNLLNKIKWDKNLNQKDYKIKYKDRILNKLVEIDFENIKEINKDFIILDNKTIPLHRIKKVEKNKKVIWD
jgi:uncharacterized protein (UPF0248 family)